MFDAFLSSAGVTVLAVNDASIDDILNRYFAAQPPFGGGKKKAEFPDAIALLAISQWAEVHDERMYVVASDGDIRAYCEEADRLIYIESVEKFLDLVVREDEASAAHVKDLITNNSDVIEERVSQDFPLLGFYISDRDGDAEVVVTGVVIEDFAIVEIAKLVATVRLEMTIDFEAHVSYEDLEHAPYDSETKSLIVLDYISETWERSEEVPCTLRVRFDPEDLSQFGVENLVINDNEDIELAYDDGWPYK